MEQPTRNLPSDAELQMGPSEIKKANEFKEDIIERDQSVINANHVEAAAVDEVYGRKVYIFNKIINEHIGMTWWQWGLLCVSGVGWLIDNAWLQGVAIILSQVGAEFKVAHPEFMTVALYAGLICGAATWGIVADIVGRRLSFNATLLIAGVFGIAAGAPTSFTALGGLLAALGFGLGGSLPVDGMLFLEFLPGNSQYLLTLLSVFWSLGQLMASLIGWAFISHYHCTWSSSSPETTDCMAPNGSGWVANNLGWRYFNFTIGAFTLACFFLRFVVFKIPESPKFLLSKGRDEEAVEAMRKFAAMCGKPLPDDMLTVGILRSAAGQDDAMDEDTSVQELFHEKPKGLMSKTLHDARMLAYNTRTISLKKSILHVKPLFSTFALGYTTVVIWVLWAFIGLAYPLFNSFILLYLEKAAGDGVSTNSLNETYRNYVIISVCGVPGSLLATWMVNLPRSGRRGAMAFGTLLSGIFLYGFTAMSTSTGTLAFSCVTAFTQNIMYGVLYCYTPESFPAPMRGTADGIASSLNRMFGILAPIIKIYGVPSNATKTQASIPIYVGATLFMVSGLLMLTLRVETSARTAL
ncbi:hypothetical protein MYAM1_000571 [Malassezia yamatoensis]|uniref:Major facilitator superfamily (MFS) profile domain-containing protein n=1 Tax=Malassezia yamatoensis TaxID=253288 RepID=A0AAJ5YS95_9BASI|nr:hypothetical protein MYAM1_000571 [Malassezia yamatoensis]